MSTKFEKYFTLNLFRIHFYPQYKLHLGTSENSQNAFARDAFENFIAFDSLLYKVNL